MVKKIALPALAIGAVILTGGAALGVLPSVGALAGKLGLSATLSGILSSAATAATIGAGGALLTGGNIIKGATTGLITGGAIGGLGAALGGGAGAAGGAAKAAGTAADAASGALPSGGLIPTGAAAAKTATLGAGAAGSVGGAASRGFSSFIDGTVKSATLPGSGTVPASQGFLGGVGDFLGKNQVLAGSLVQGLGQGMAAKEDAKSRARERERREASYAGLDQGLYFMPQGTEGMGPLIDPAMTMPAPQGGKVRYDRRTGQLVPVG